MINDKLKEYFLEDEKINNIKEELTIKAEKSVSLIVNPYIAVFFISSLMFSFYQFFLNKELFAILNSVEYLNHLDTLKLDDFEISKAFSNDFIVIKHLVDPILLNSQIALNIYLFFNVTISIFTFFKVKSQNYVFKYSNSIYNSDFYLITFLTTLIIFAGTVSNYYYSDFLLNNFNFITFLSFCVLFLLGVISVIYFFVLAISDSFFQDFKNHWVAKPFKTKKEINVYIEKIKSHKRKKEILRNDMKKDNKIMNEAITYLNNRNIKHKETHLIHSLFKEIKEEKEREIIHNGYKELLFSEQILEIENC